MNEQHTVYYGMDLFVCGSVGLFADGRNVAQGVLQIGVIHVAADLRVVEGKSGYEQFLSVKHKIKYNIKGS